MNQYQMIEESHRLFGDKYQTTGQFIVDYINYKQNGKRNYCNKEQFKQEAQEHGVTERELFEAWREFYACYAAKDSMLTDPGEYVMKKKFQRKNLKNPFEAIVC